MVTFKNLLFKYFLIRKNNDYKNVLLYKFLILKYTFLSEIFIFVWFVAVMMMVMICNCLCLFIWKEIIRYIFAGIVLRYKKWEEKKRNDLLSYLAPLRYGRIMRYKTIQQIPPHKCELYLKNSKNNELHIARGCLSKVPF